MKGIKVSWSHSGAGNPIRFFVSRITAPVTYSAPLVVPVNEVGVASVFSVIDEFDPTSLSQVQYRITAQSKTALSPPVDTEVFNIVLAAPETVTTEILPDS